MKSHESRRVTVEERALRGLEKRAEEGGAAIMNRCNDIRVCESVIMKPSILHTN